MFHDRLDPVSQTSVKLPHMSALHGAIKTRFPVSGQFIGKVLVTCPNCGRVISSRQNWNTWKVTCKSCETILIAYIHSRPRKNALKRGMSGQLILLCPGPLYCHGRVENRPTWSRFKWETHRIPPPHFTKCLSLTR